MKTTFLSGTLLVWAALSPLTAGAQEVGQVLSRSPVYQQVIVPRQTCTQVPVAQPTPSTGAGSLLGAIAGGAMGNAIGDGSGRALATMIGIVGGAMVGDRIEGSQGALVQNQTLCNTQNVYENRLIGYNVVYEYAGKEYSVQVPQDPGPTIPLQVTPVGQGLRSEGPVLPALAPKVVYVPAPVYPIRAPSFSHIDLSWHSPRPVVRYYDHPGFPAHVRGHRHSAHFDRGHWR